MQIEHFMAVGSIDPSILMSAVSIALATVGIPLGIVLVRIWAKSERHEIDIRELKADHKEMRHDFNGMKDAMSEIREMFGVIKSQISRLFESKETQP